MPACLQVLYQINPFHAFHNIRYKNYFQYLFQGFIQRMINTLELSVTNYAIWQFECPIGVKSLELLIA